MLEPTVARRVLAGVVVACLVLGAGLLGWLRAAGGRRDQEVDLPARGGILTDGSASTDGSTPTNGSTRLAVGGGPDKPLDLSSGRLEPSSRGGSRSATVHRVAEGDTLFRIAKQYGLQAAELQEANGLASDLIRPGQLLVLPGGAGGQPSVLTGTFIWPTLAPISSNFGPRWGRHHNGLDLAANHGDQIRASRDGEVWVAGTVPGYGETVIVVHTDGSRTLYAHASKLMVKAGEKVKQGQAIALVGSTGNSTGPHLHFEIIVNDRPVDPLLHLPKR